MQSRCAVSCTTWIRASSRKCAIRERWDRSADLISAERSPVTPATDPVPAVAQLLDRDSVLAVLAWVALVLAHQIDEAFALRSRHADAHFVGMLVEVVEHEQPVRT